MTNSPTRPLPHVPNYVMRTAFHMADAVGYLVSVAQNSGMRAIAVKLAAVRSDLLVLASDEHPAEDNPDSRVKNGEGNGRVSKLN